MANKITTLLDSNNSDQLYPRTKFAAVSDDDGNLLGNIASYNGVDVLNDVEALDIGVGMELLWTNASPTSSFAAQTIAVNLSGYGLVLITYMMRTSINDILASPITPVGYGGMMATKNTGLANLRFRYFVSSVSGVRVEPATGTGGTTVENDFCIPYQIYGVKSAYIIPGADSGLIYEEV